jgi:hypothetical protein
MSPWQRLVDGHGQINADPPMLHIEVSEACPSRLASEVRRVPVPTAGAERRAGLDLVDPFPYTLSSRIRRGTAMRRSGITLVALLFNTLVAGCVANQAPQPTDTVAPQVGAVIKDRCSRSLDYSVLDLDAAGSAATLDDDLQLGTLGPQGASDLATELLSLDGSFCSIEIPSELSSELDQVERLVQSGQDSLAAQRLSELIDSVAQDAYSSVDHSNISFRHFQVGEAKTRAAVRAYLAIAAHAQAWGSQEASDTALSAARKTFGSWASGAIENASIDEALTIGAEAQLLGLDDLSFDAIRRAADLTRQDFEKSLAGFKPCSSTEEDARTLLEKAAAASLLGYDVDTFALMDTVREWKDIQEKRSRGEPVPECDVWQLEMSFEFSTSETEVTIAWAGVIKIDAAKAIAGTGTGTVTGTGSPCRVYENGALVHEGPTPVIGGEFPFDLSGQEITSNGEPTFALEIAGEAPQITIEPLDEMCSFGYDLAEEFIRILATDIQSMLPSGRIEVPAVDGGTNSVQIPELGLLRVTVFSPGE